MAVASEPKESPVNNPGLISEKDEDTKEYFLQQTMLQVKDPKASLDFYSRVLGMSLFSAMRRFMEFRVFIVNGAIIAARILPSWLDGDMPSISVFL